MKSVVLYSRADCHLCVEAEDFLRCIQRENRFSLRVVDIDKDMEAHDRYWLRIPVVLVDGEEVASAPIDQGRLAAAIER